MSLQDLGLLLEDMARVVGADGVIVWVWSPQSAALKPVVGFGYSETLLERLPAVRRDADNATASAFRLAHTEIVDGGEQKSGAIVAPLLTPTGCAGVLAVEFWNDGERSKPVQALVTIFAALVAACFASPPLAGAVNA
jgi:hypothetical protein